MFDPTLTALHARILASLSARTVLTPASDRRGNHVHRYPAPCDFPNGKNVIEVTFEFEWFHTVDLDGADALARVLMEGDGRALGGIGLGVSGQAGALLVRHEPRPDAPQATDEYLDAADRPLLAAQATIRHRIEASDFMTWGNGSTNIELPYARPRRGLGQRIEWNLNTGRMPVSTLARQALADSGMPDVALNPFHWLCEAVPSLNPEALEPQVRIQKTRKKFTLNDPHTGAKRQALNIDRMVAEAPDGRQAVYADVELAMEGDVGPDAFQLSGDVVEALRASFGLAPNDATRYDRAIAAVDAA